LVQLLQFSTFKQFQCVFRIRLVHFILILLIFVIFVIVIGYIVKEIVCFFVTKVNIRLIMFVYVEITLLINTIDRLVFNAVVELIITITITITIMFIVTVELNPR